MKKLFLLAFAILSMLLSCGKMEDPDLGEFRRWESYIDMSQKNKFDESLFCKEWVVDKVYLVTYVDGKQRFKEDRTNDVIPWNNYVFKKDHSMSYGEEKGCWLYSHNHLMWQMPFFDIFSAAMEVQNVTSDALTLKCEIMQPDRQTPFFKDKSGTHVFYVLQLNAK